MQAIMQTKQIKIYFFCNPKLKTNLSGILGKNSLRNRLIRPVYKFSKSVLETSSKMREPKTYNKAINNLIYRNRFCKATTEEL